MAQSVDNGFTTYEFTDEELISAATFSQMQRMYIQTKRAQAAMDKVAMQFDPKNPAVFAQQVAYYDGFIAACDFLLDHEAAEDAAERWAELKAAGKLATD